jgi:methyl-accepting chemotaxis protein
MQFSSMKISSRLALAFGAVLLMSIGAAGLALKDMATIQAAMEDVVTDNNVKVRLNHEMSDAVHVVTRVMRSIIVLDDKAAREQELAKITQARAVYDKAWEALNKMTASETGRAVRAKILAARDFARPLNDKVIELGMAGDDAQARPLLMADASPATEKWQDAIKENIAFQEAASQTQYQASSQDYVAARNTLIGANVLCIGLAMALGWAVTRSITRQLGTEPAEAVELARSVAAGDLSTHIRLAPGDHDSMMAQLAQMQQGLAKVVSTVRQNAESVATASAQIAQGNQDLSQRTEEQASALEQTAASMEELGSTVVQNADNARQANELAATASTVAVQGGEVVGQVVDTMKGINDSSRKIGDIISVIDGIAFQTNILALNAAVEAARAGEQGRGFAVVAAEVRSLAQRSADAAKEIKTLITASVEQVEKGTVLVDQAGSTMQEVVGAISRVSDIMGEINSASNEQSAGVSQVGEAVSQMDQTTQQNAALVEQSAAAESLRQQAQQLVQAVAVFKL